jgi:pimeloyl-ACP methyl ester carboxylesterase
MPLDGWLERGGVRLHYLEWEGGDGPPFLLLHGLSSNARFWARTAGLLGGHRVIALDQRSHGRSDRPPSGYSHEALAADGLHAISKLGLERPVVAGHSWGAAIALELAATHPDQIGGLGIIDGPVWPMSERISWEEAQKVMQPSLPRYTAPDEALAAAQASLKSAWADDLVPFVEASLVEDGGAWVPTLTAPVRLEILHALYNYHPELLWPLVEAPVTLISARSDSPFDQFRRRAVAAVEEVRPDVVMRWYDSPHDIPLYLPAEVAADLLRLSVRAEWSALSHALLALDGDWKRPVGPEWSTHDLLAHLSSSQTALVRVIKAEPAPVAAAAEPDKPREPFDADRWNASQIRRRLETPAEELRQEFQRAAEELEQLLGEADLERELLVGAYGEGTLGGYLQFMLRHQREHVEELRQALE